MSDYKHASGGLDLAEIKIEMISFHLFLDLLCRLILQLKKTQLPEDGGAKAFLSALTQYWRDILSIYKDNFSYIG